jgi:hypothetical protein
MATKQDDKKTKIDMDKIHRPLADPEDPRLADPERIPPPDEEARDAEIDLRVAQGKKALQDVKDGVTTPTEDDLKVGMSHPAIVNRPGDAGTPATVGEPPQLTPRTQEEQNAGRTAVSSADAGMKAVQQQHKPKELEKPHQEPTPTGSAKPR